MILKGSDALKFLIHMKHNENKKVGPVPTPKLERAVELIRKMENEYSLASLENTPGRGNLSKVKYSPENEE